MSCWGNYGKHPYLCRWWFCLRGRTLALHPLLTISNGYIRHQWMQLSSSLCALYGRKHKQHRQLHQTRQGLARRGKLLMYIARLTVLCSVVRGESYGQKCDRRLRFYPENMTQVGTWSCDYLVQMASRQPETVQNNN
jgi:hypothetical protein